MLSSLCRTKSAVRRQNTEPWRWLDSSPTLTAEQTRLVDAQLVGNYAIAPTWGDGHHTGYYPFALLRERCSCSECAPTRTTTEVAS